EGELLNVVAAYNWPQAYAAYLNEMRVRAGNGPTGRAVEENQVVEVFDIFADPGLQNWWEPARELGFSSSVALPIAFDGRPIGAITFYFSGNTELGEADRSLLRLVADQLAGTAEKAHLIENLQLANERLRIQNVELEERYREAEEARRLKGEFLANISHELRTPLTAILGYTYLLREGLSGELGPEPSGAVEKIEAAGTSLMGLISDLLDLTNLKLGRSPMEPEMCDAALMARAALSMLPAVPASVRMRTELPTEAVHLFTDPGQVVRILQNLLSNAVKFTPRGTVTMRARAVQVGPGGAPSVIWEVEDTGIGIAAEKQEAIFDEFLQVDGSATRLYGGSGLGLALSRGLARQLGGEITVRSVPGEGSTFALILPSSRAPIHGATLG
nr:GAF domain-containing sensor histidine kinase [Gemmatimonadota bacterium]